MQLVVLNPGGKDPAQPFPDMAGPADAALHAPINYHAYAACTGGRFERDTAKVEGGPVLLLLRRDLKEGLKALRQLKAKGCCVAVSWKESGLHQVAAQLDSAPNIGLFREICALVDGALSSTPNLVPIYKSAGAKQVAFIPTPYPLEDPRWNFSQPAQERVGVFVGTREFSVPTRNHLAAVMLATGLGAPVTVFNFEGRTARKKLEALGCSRIIEKRLSYPEYLRVMSRHRLVLQLDRSSVPGQVAGDALLCGIPCIGGDGAVDQLAFPEAHGLGLEQIGELARKLLSDSELNNRWTTKAVATARKRLGFSVVAEELEAFFGRIAG